jgi:hemerythrin-like domain-containing protein
MHYASEDLKDEHDGILFGLEILEKMTEQLQKNRKVEKGDFREMINFLKLFADKCHHGKEEGLLFPAMEKVGIQNQNGPIGQMLIEHAEGRKYISQMSEAIKDNSVNENDLIQAATNYIRLLRQHIEKENAVLFPMGDRKIPAEIQADLLTSFEEFEEKVMGKGTHEKLHELLKKFEIKYLKNKALNK